MLNTKACMPPELRIGNSSQHDALVLDGREIVGGRPVLGAVLGAPVDLVGLEGLERDGRVAEIFVAQLVEIVARRR